MGKLKVNHYVVGMVQTNCYVAYNDETKEIKFDCFETTEEMITNIKIVEMSEDILELDFNGEIRKFEKSE